MKETVGIKMHESCIDCPRRTGDWCLRLMNGVSRIQYCKLWAIEADELRLIE